MIELAISAGLGLVAAAALLRWGATLGTRWQRLREELAHRTGRLRTPVDGARARRRRRAFDDQVVDWMDMLYVAASCGLNLPEAIERTRPAAGDQLAAALNSCLSRYRTGDSLLEALVGEMEAAGETAGEVAWLLADSMREGLPLASALAELREHLLRQRRARVGAHLKTLGLRITLVTVFFLFPPAFVLIVLPNVLTFITS